MIAVVTFRVVYFTEVFLCVLRNKGPKPQGVRTWPKHWKPFDEIIFVLHYTMSVDKYNWTRL